jgi:hypothetical protein
MTQGDERACHALMREVTSRRGRSGPFQRVDCGVWTVASEVRIRRCIAIVPPSGRSADDDDRSDRRVSRAHLCGPCDRRPNSSMPRGRAAVGSISKSGTRAWCTPITAASHVRSHRVVPSPSRISEGTQQDRIGRQTAMTHARSHTRSTTTNTDQTMAISPSDVDKLALHGV